MDPKTLQYQAGLAGFVTDRNSEGLTHDDSVKQPPHDNSFLSIQTRFSTSRERSNSSFRVPDRPMSIAGKIRLSMSRRSK